MNPADTPSKSALFKTLGPIIAIILLVIAALFVLRAAGPGGGHSGHDHSAAKVGSTVPDFEFQVFGGKNIKLSEVPGKLLFINFWATWCEACMVEMPSILQLRSSFKDRGLEVVVINLDEKPDEVVPKALKNLGIDFPVYLDPESKAGDAFDVSAIPMTVILDKDRKVLLMHAGDRNWNGTDIRAQVEQWLAQ